MNDDIEEFKETDQNIEIEFEDDLVQTPNKEYFGNVKEELMKDSLMYSCDANEDAEEGEIASCRPIKNMKREKKRVNYKIDEDKDDSLDRAVTDEGLNININKDEYNL